MRMRMRMQVQVQVQVQVQIVDRGPWSSRRKSLPAAKPR
ncbi:hypothetical protein X979_710 [Burkholderia pseudomallei MSHR7527]|nr:hypothetical protein X979_710 [Burkholderia pseudomallei MSHR7527]